MALAVTALTGVVLAGGASRRMGSDKALLTIDGRPLVEHAFERLSEVCVEVLVASGDGLRLPGPWRQVADVSERAGPLAGLIAGLRAAETPLVAAVAVDLPDASPALLAWLAECWDGRAWAIVPRTRDRLEPLHAVYATGAADRLHRELTSGRRSLTRLLESSDDAHIIPRRAWSAVASPGFAVNLNTPDEAADAGIQVSPPEGLTREGRR